MNRVRLFFNGIGVLFFLVGCKEVSAPPPKHNTNNGSQTGHAFLWVVDNSNSLQWLKDGLKNNMASFIETFQKQEKTPYRMAVTTTDMFAHQGKLVQSADGMTVARSTSLDPVKDMLNILDKVEDTTTSFWEQGLESGYQAIYRNPDVFQTKDTALNVIYLTNAEDWSCQDYCYGVEPENNTNYVRFGISRYIGYFDSLETPDSNMFVSVFPMVGKVDSPCGIESEGTRYIQVKRGKGVDGTICESKFREKLLEIAEILSKNAEKQH